MKFMRGMLVIMKFMRGKLVILEILGVGWTFADITKYINISLIYLYKVIN